MNHWHGFRFHWGWLGGGLGESVNDMLSSIVPRVIGLVRISQKGVMNVTHSQSGVKCEGVVGLSLWS